MKFSKPEEIIPNLLEKFGITPQNYMAFEIWEKEFTDLNDSIKLIGIKDDTLFVKVSTSVHSNELKINKKEILSRINKYYEFEKFKEIRRVK